MLTFAETGVIPRQILEELNVACQTHSGVGSFNQIVAQKSIFGKALSNRCFESLKIIEPFTHKTPLFKQILIDV